MTGRAAGYCAGYGVPGYANAAGGRGFGLGRGFGRGGWGRRNWYHATGLTGWQRAVMPAWGGYAPNPAYGAYGAPYGPTKEQEAEMLKTQSEYLKEQLANLQKRMDELESDKK